MKNFKAIYHIETTLKKLSNFSFEFSENLHLIEKYEKEIAKQLEAEYESFLKFQRRFLAFYLESLKKINVRQLYKLDF